MGISSLKVAWGESWWAENEVREMGFASVTKGLTVCCFVFLISMEKKNMVLFQLCFIWKWCNMKEDMKTNFYPVGFKRDDALLHRDNGCWIARFVILSC